MTAAAKSEGGAVLGIGLDLGALNVRVAYAGDSHVRTLTWDDGRESTASAIGMDDGKLVHGRAALALLAKHAQDVVVEPLLLEGSALLSGVRYPVEELVGWWFSLIAARVRQEAGPMRQRFMVCVPYEHRERVNTLISAAASRSGTELVNTVQSTTAAAVGHGWATGARDTVLLVADAGARKVEAAVVRLQPGRVNVLARAGESTGGRYLDERLAEACIKELVPGLDPRRLDPARRAEVIAGCEQARWQLSTESTARVHVSFLGSDAVWSVTRDRLEKLAEPVRLATERACERVLAESKIDASRLGGVLAIGALARMPLVMDAIRESTGREPDAAGAENLAAQGAAVIAAVMSGLALPAQPSGEEPSTAPQRSPRTPAPARESAPPQRPAARPSLASHLLSRISTNPPPPPAPVIRPSVEIVLEGARSQRPPAIIDSSAASGPKPEDRTKVDAALRAFLDEEEPKAEARPAARREVPIVEPKREPISRPPAPARRDSPGVAPMREMSIPGSVTPKRDDGLRRGAEAQGEVRLRESEPRNEPVDPRADTLVGMRVGAVEPKPVVDEERPSLAPPGARGSIPPGSMMPLQGRFIGVRDAADILALPLRRPIGPADLEPIRLPALLMALGRRKDLTGMLELTRGDSTLRWALSQGGALMDSPKSKDRFLACFLWEEGTYRIELRGEGKGASEPLSKLVVDGLRWVLRQEREDSLEALLADKLDKAPKSSVRGRALASAVGLWPSEQRFLRYQCDGSLTGHEACKSGGVAHCTALQVIFLLDVLGEVTWGEPERKAGPSLQQQVESRAAEAPFANYFDLLGLHWSVDEREVKTAFERMEQSYGPDSEAAKVAPDACLKLMGLARTAHDMLIKRQTRVQYLLKIKPDLDVLALTELMKTRAEALEMKGDQVTATSAQRLVQDMDPFAKAAAAKVIDLSRLRDP